MANNDVEYSSRIFLLASEERWDVLQEQVQSLLSSDNISALLEPYGPLAPEPIPPDSSLLHVVCSYPSVPTSLVQLLLTTAPELATSSDELGRTPLHIALVEGACQPPIIRLLTRAAPEAAQHRDDSYCTPIEVLAQMILMQEERSKYAKAAAEQETTVSRQLKSKTNRLWECVQPLAVAVTDPPDWDAPLLHACFRATPRGFPFALMERVRNEHEDQFQTTDSKGNYPLHIVAGWDPEEEDLEDELCQVARLYPAAAKATNHEGKLPLDIASEGGLVGWDTGMAVLLEVYPAPERFPLGVTSYLLARAAQQGRTTLLFEVLRNQPGLFN